MELKLKAASGPLISSPPPLLAELSPELKNPLAELESQVPFFFFARRKEQTRSFSCIAINMWPAFPALPLLPAVIKEGPCAQTPLQLFLKTSSLLLPPPFPLQRCY